MIYSKYDAPNIKELFVRLEEGFASSVESGIGDVTEETGTWD